MMIAYCDKIAQVVRKSLLGYDPDNIIGLIGPIEMDLHPTGKYFVSPKKTIEMTDFQNKKYKITIEEIN
tara:strand:+ start:126 stop:332 length:207 start_codon:yes stop_codon:yes gene_type:complete